MLYTKRLFLIGLSVKKYQKYGLLKIDPRSTIFKIILMGSYMYNVYASLWRLEKNGIPNSFIFEVLHVNLSTWTRQPNQNCPWVSYFYYQKYIYIYNIWCWHNVHGLMYRWKACSYVKKCTVQVQAMYIPFFRILSICLYIFQRSQ